MEPKALILDTHVWLWWVSDDGRLPRAMRDLLLSPSTTLYLSAASAWEIGIKAELGKLKLPSAGSSYVPELLARSDTKTLEIHTLHTLCAAELPSHHRDPFDRVLIAQSILEKIPLVTADRAFEPYEKQMPRRILWAD